MNFTSKVMRELKPNTHPKKARMRWMEIGVKWAKSWRRGAAADLVSTRI